jgi:Flp pilus assembly protein TadG
MKRKHERGATTVEFALVSIPAIVLLLGSMQYGYYFYVAEQTSGAASTVARKLAVGDCWEASPDKALEFARNASAQVDTVTKNPSSISATTPRGTAITVTVTAEADIVGFIPMPDGGTITRKVTTRLEDTTAATC